MPHFRFCSIYVFMFDFHWHASCLSCHFLLTGFLITVIRFTNDHLLQLGVSNNNGTPKSSIAIFKRVFHDFHHPFWGTILLVDYGTLVSRSKKFPSFTTPRIPGRLASGSFDFAHVFRALFQFELGALLRVFPTGRLQSRLPGHPWKTSDSMRNHQPLWHTQVAESRPIISAVYLVLSSERRKLLKKKRPKKSLLGPGFHMWQDLILVSILGTNSYSLPPASDDFPNFLFGGRWTRSLEGIWYFTTDITWCEFAKPEILFRSWSVESTELEPQPVERHLFWQNVLKS